MSSSQFPGTHLTALSYFQISIYRYFRQKCVFGLRFPSSIRQPSLVYSDKHYFLNMSIKKRSNNVRAVLLVGHLHLDKLLSLKNSAKTSIIFLPCEHWLHLAGTRHTTLLPREVRWSLELFWDRHLCPQFYLYIYTHTYIHTGSMFRNCAPDVDFNWL